jgi:hypothetical protein
MADEMDTTGTGGGGGDNSMRTALKRKSTIAQQAVHQAAHSAKKNLKKTIKDQNNQQTMSLVFYSLFELYKAVTASLLILFVTQECSDGECTIEENFHTDDGDTHGMKKLYQAGLAFNFATLAVFGVLYLLEILREKRLIEYLEENPEALFTNDAVGEALQFLDAEKLKTILFIEKWYKTCGGLAIVMYLTNIIVSGLIIQHYSVGFYTWISFMTLTLFIAKKFIAVYFLIKTDSHIYLSAYMTNPLQYNDVDPEYKLPVARAHDAANVV